MEEAAKSAGALSQLQALVCCKPIQRNWGLDNCQKWDVRNNILVTLGSLFIA
jgi:hypothetical protein